VGSEPNLTTGPTGPDAPASIISVVLPRGGFLIILGAIIGALMPLGSILCAAYAVWTWTAKEVTQPMAGCTLSVSRSEVTDGKNLLPAVTVRQYEAFNPGPGELDSAVLNIMLREKYNNETEPPTGLYVEPLGKVKITYARGPDGKSTQCTVAPWYYDKIDIFPPGRCIGALFVSHTANWTPIKDGTNLYLSGGVPPIPAFDEITLPKRASTLRHLVLPGVGLLAGAILFILYVWYARRAIPALANKAVAKLQTVIEERAIAAARPEIERQAIVRAGQDYAEMMAVVRSLPGRLEEMLQQKNLPPTDYPSKKIKPKQDVH